MKFRALIFTLCFVASAQAQIEVYGEQTGTWGETTNLYLVIGDVIVPASNSLTILPGVEVRFMGMYKISVNNGWLIAAGTEEDSIRFVSPAGNPGTWKYLEFNQTLGSETTLSYCVIKSGERAISVNDCRVNLDHCLLRGHSLSAVEGDGAQIYLNECTITQNLRSGINAENSSVYVTNCTITANSGNAGINAQADASITVIGGFIGDNAGSGIYGIQPTLISLDGVEIGNNDQDGITLTWCDELEAARVLIHHNELHGMLLANTPLDAYKLTISSNGNNGINFSGNTNHLLKLHSSIIDRNDQYGIYFQSGTDFLNYNDAYLNGFGNYYNCDPGQESIEEDPRYVNYAGTDFHLLEDSPCIDSGNSNPTFNDPDGTRADMGAFYFDQSSGIIGQETGAQTIKTLSIVKAYPNPFNPLLTLQVQAQIYASGRLDAYTSDGRLAAGIWEGMLQPGINTIPWRANGLASGRYFIRLQSGQIIDVYPCIYMK